MSSSFAIILDRVKKILSELEKGNITAKVAVDPEAKLIKIYGEGSDYIKRASAALAEIQELAYTTAEHHPFWAILYHASELSKSVLDKWDGRLTNDQISEMAWRCDEIKMSLDRLAEA